MKLLTLTLALGLSGIYFGCNTSEENLQDPNQTKVEQSDGKLFKSTKNEKVKICHLTSSGYQVIEVSLNAAQAHYAHGDLNPDADGDGFTAAYGTLNPCDLGNGDDCDDTDSNVHPGASTVCDDGIDNNCDGSIDKEVVQVYVPCENCTGGTSGSTYNPTNGKCAPLKANGQPRNNYVPCSTTVCVD